MSLANAKWLDRAACATSDANFHPDLGESAAEALAVCRTCPVIAECADHAARNGERNGVWGGQRFASDSGIEPGNTQKVLDALSRNDWATLGHVTLRTGLGKHAARMTLGALVADGYAVRTKPGPGRPAQWKKVA